MTLRGASLLALTLAFSTPAIAGESGFYGGPHALLGFADNSDITRDPVQATPINNSSDGAGANGGGGVWFGYNFGTQYDVPIKTELSVTGRFRHDMNLDGTLGLPQGVNIDIQSVDVMASALWDIPLGFRLQPYIGGGAGMVHHTVDAINFGDTSEWEAAWQLQAGATYPITDSIDFRADYRYIDMGTVTTTTLTTTERYSADFTSHDILLGAVWKF